MILYMYHPREKYRFAMKRAVAPVQRAFQKNSTSSYPVMMHSYMNSTVDMYKSLVVVSVREPGWKL